MMVDQPILTYSVTSSTEAPSKTGVEIGMPEDKFVDQFIKFFIHLKV